MFILKIYFAVYREFEALLQEQAPMEAYTEWLDSMVARCVVQPSTRKPRSIRRIARQFLLMWSCFGTRVIRDMTLHSAPSFGESRSYVCSDSKSLDCRMYLVWFFDMLWAYLYLQIQRRFQIHRLFALIFYLKPNYVLNMICTIAEHMRKF